MCTVTFCNVGLIIPGNINNIVSDILLYIHMFINSSVMIGVVHFKIQKSLMALPLTLFTSGQMRCDVLLDVITGVLRNTKYIGPNFNQIFPAGIIKMNIVDNANSSTVVLNATVVADSWWATVGCYLPESVEQPPAVSWLTLANRAFTGKVLYPI